MSHSRHLRNLALIGFMGTGKSTVGQLLAGQLGFEFLDTDHLIEGRAGLTVAQIFAAQGEAVFRSFEAEIVDELRTRDKVVMATGGGLGADAEHLASLKTHAFVACLWASPESIWKRVRHQKHRPLLQGPDPFARLTELLARRAPIYRQADVLVNTDQRSPRQVAHQVLHEFKTATLQG